MRQKFRSKQKLWSVNKIVSALFSYCFFFPNTLFSTGAFFRVRFFPARFFPVRLFPVRFFPVLLFPVRFFPVRLFPVRFFPVLLFPVRFFPVRLFPVRFFPVRLFPVRFFPVRFFPRTCLSWSHYNLCACLKGKTIYVLGKRKLILVVIILSSGWGRV